MAYGFNTNKSKIEVYSKEEMDAIIAEIDPSGIARNIVDGGATGSSRSVGSTVEEQGVYSLGMYSFTHGRNTKAPGWGAHAEGVDTLADNYGSHAEGSETTAYADYSHTEGIGTSARGKGQTVVGMYNIPEGAEDQIVDPSCPIFIVGNGSDNSNRSNAFTVDLTGRITSWSHKYVVDTTWYESSFGRTSSVSNLIFYMFGNVVMLTGSFKATQSFTLDSGTGFESIRVLSVPSSLTRLFKYVPPDNIKAICFEHNSSVRLYTEFTHQGYLNLGLVHNNTSETFAVGEVFDVQMMWLSNPMNINNWPTLGL